MRIRIKGAQGGRERRDLMGRGSHIRRNRFEFTFEKCGWGGNSGRLKLLLQVGDHLTEPVCLMNMAWCGSLLSFAVKRWSSAPCLNYFPSSIVHSCLFFSWKKNPKTTNLPVKSHQFSCGWQRKAAPHHDTVAAIFHCINDASSEICTVHFLSHTAFQLGWTV